MKALKFSEAKGLRLEDVDIPSVNASEPKSISPNALIRVLRAAVCSTDLEITDGYVPGFDFTLGHEFVGVVESIDLDKTENGESCINTAAPDIDFRNLIGKRVVGEINCPCEPCNHPDPIFVRNHAPVRTVLGIIGRDGAMANYVSVPVANLHLVPDEVSDQQACFAEPLAAACRIVEQVPLKQTDSIAVIGDGKLGLLAAHVLVVNGLQVTLFGRHEEKMSLIEGLRDMCVVESNDQVIERYNAAFDCVVEATGSPKGIILAAGLTAPLGTLVLKSTCSISDPSRVPLWSQISNDIVVQEKTLIGSRCGPFEPALRMLEQGKTQRLVDAMVHKVFSLEQAVDAIKAARERGVLKVQIVCNQA